MHDIYTFKVWGDAFSMQCMCACGVCVRERVSYIDMRVHIENRLQDVVLHLCNVVCMCMCV